MNKTSPEDDMAMAITEDKVNVKDGKRELTPSAGRREETTVTERAAWTKQKRWKRIRIGPALTLENKRDLVWRTISIAHQQHSQCRKSGALTRRQAQSRHHPDRRF